MRKQKDVHRKVIAIVGVGGTGCHAASLLARSGVKKLILIDCDTVEEKNLDRQILYGKDDVGKMKVFVAKERLEQFCTVEARLEYLDAKNIEKNIDIKNVDLVVDCTDNIATRLILNDYCKKHHLPWIHTGAVREIGSVWFISPKGPCFQCLNQENYGEKSCIAGVNPAAVALVGNIAASLALAYLKKETVSPELLRIHLQNNTLQKIKVRRSPHCSACKKKFIYLSGTKRLDSELSSC